MLLMLFKAHKAARTLLVQQAQLLYLAAQAAQWLLLLPKQVAHSQLLAAARLHGYQRQPAMGLHHTQQHSIQRLISALEQ